ncbi:MAG: hypothetical protein QNI92_18550 [Desulfobacterales bacterium]|nr:hypothetical protein [Desulfobacterales bacterium]
MNVQTIHRKRKLPIHFNRTRHFATLLLFRLSILRLLRECKDLRDADKQIPIEAAVYHDHRAVNSHKAYLDIDLGHFFPEKLADDFDSITATGSDGGLPLFGTNILKSKLVKIC